MKRKHIFSQSEITEIRKLIDLKVKSDKNEQKKIRNKIREIGFHYSDFSSSKKGYTNADLDELIRGGQVLIK